jgi:dephospho-CoA kinase
MTVRLGLTGPIGCGKSTVAGWLGEQPGIVVVDADRVAREVLAPGTAATAAVIARFGPAIAEDGAIDRAALGRIVFADAEALRDLEAIVHPAVRPRILAAITGAERDGARACVVEAIKLVEGGLAELCDAVWLVDCDRARQVERLVGRGMARDDAEARIASQGDLADRLRASATTVIDTNADPAATRARVEAALTALLDGGGADAPGLSPTA